MMMMMLNKMYVPLPFVHNVKHLVALKWIERTTAKWPLKTSITEYNKCMYQHTHKQVLG
jgi:hypothetical protein